MRAMRRIRGAIGMGLTWAIGWAIAGLLIGAGSVVLHAVPAHCTVAGVPAKVIGCAGCDRPSQAMDQIIDETSG